MGQRIREMHKHIKGVKPDGERYHALEPEAYAWVHATLAHSIVRGHACSGSPIPADELDDFYADWRRGGRLIGVRERDLPESWAEFGEYFDRMVEERLERTAAVDEVLEALEGPDQPRLPFLPESGVARRPHPGHAPDLPGHRRSARAEAARTLRGQLDARQGEPAAGPRRRLASRDAAAAADRCATSAPATCAGGTRRSPAATPLRRRASR